ncbi:MAG: hypothetical protein NC311_12420 [Muribaculaceae bacterium]|nr:hypothetical protein [Muribaculaceae bacterium]
MPKSVLRRIIILLKIIGRGLAYPMATMQSILEESTQAMASSLRAERLDPRLAGTYRRVDGTWDYGLIEQDLVSSIRARVSTCNNYIQKGEAKMHTPASLDTAQIAAVLRATMDLEPVTDEKGRRSIGIRQRDGTVSSDLRPVYCAAMKLNRRLTRRSLSLITERILLDIDYGGA